MLTIQSKIHVAGITGAEMVDFMLHFSAESSRAMDEHATLEFPKLGAMLRAQTQTSPLAR